MSAYLGRLANHMLFFIYLLKKRRSEAYLRTVTQKRGRPSPAIGASRAARFVHRESRFAKKAARMARNFSAYTARCSSSSCCTCVCVCAWRQSIRHQHTSAYAHRPLVVQLLLHWRVCESSCCTGVCVRVGKKKGKTSSLRARIDIRERDLERLL